MTRIPRPRVRTVAVVVLASLGTAMGAVGILSQGQPPRPPPSAAGSVTPTSTASTSSTSTSAAPLTATTSPRRTAVAPSSTAKPVTESPKLAPAPIPEPTPQKPAASLEVLPQSQPVAIDIPKIGVHSELQHLGLTQDGELEVPAPGPRYNDAAWYRYSPTPGALGPAIISGHVDSAEDGPSVFSRLGHLRPGDIVMVSRADGLVAEFTVSGVRVFPKDEFPTTLVYGNTDTAALRLITCGGAFDSAVGHYADNVVVFASLSGWR